MRRGVLLIAATLSAVALGACGSSSEKQPAAETVSYTVRGRVLNLPAEESPAPEIIVRHEPIPSFKNAQGVVGMESMAMPFPLGEDLSLEGIEPGDPVELTFEVDHDPETQQIMSLRAVEITKLPAETTLRFDEAASERSEEADPSTSGAGG